MLSNITARAIATPGLCPATVLTLGVVTLYLLALPAPLQATTYYVDFSGGADTNAGTIKSSPWRHAKGMVGCTSVCNSTALGSGDTVIFKGGVTWTGWGVWNLSGGSSSDLLYTTDHTWYSGPSYSQPVFDNQGADQAGGAIRSNSVNYIHLDDLKIINCGNQPRTVSSHYCLVFYEGSNISVTNCTFQSNDWITVFFNFPWTAGSYSNFTFTGNDVSHTSNAIWIASNTPGISLHNFNISNNAFHDYHDNMVGGTHGNALHYYTSPHGDATQYLDGMTFCGNRTYGDFTSNGTFVDNVSGGGMTAFFFFEDPLSGVVCNNDFSFSPVQASMFNALLALGKSSNQHNIAVGVYGNSLANTGANAMSSGITVTGMTAGDTITLENNIASGMTNCVYVQDTPSVSALATVDYNLWNCSSGQNKLASTYYSYPQWRALGYDRHGVLGRDPSWVAPPGNEHLKNGSPAINSGANLSSVGVGALSSDADGVSRPSSAPWDIGAFQFRDTLSPPSGLTGIVR